MSDEAVPLECAKITIETEASNSKAADLVFGSTSSNSLRDNQDMKKDLSTDAHSSRMPVESKKQYLLIKSEKPVDKFYLSSQGRYGAIKKIEPLYLRPPLSSVPKPSIVFIQPAQKETAKHLTSPQKTRESLECDISKSQPNTCDTSTADNKISNVKNFQYSKEEPAEASAATVPSISLSSSTAIEPSIPSKQQVFHSTKPEITTCSAFYTPLKQFQDEKKEFQFSNKLKRLAEFNKSALTSSKRILHSGNSNIFPSSKRSKSLDSTNEVATSNISICKSRPIKTYSTPKKRKMSAPDDFTLPSSTTAKLNQDIKKYSPPSSEIEKRVIEFLSTNRKKTLQKEGLTPLSDSKILMQNSASTSSTKNQNIRDTNTSSTERPLVADTISAPSKIKLRKTTDMKSPTDKPNWEVVSESSHKKQTDHTYKLIRHSSSPNKVKIVKINSNLFRSRSSIELSTGERHSKLLKKLKTPVRKKHEPPSNSNTYLQPSPDKHRYQLSKKPVLEYKKCTLSSSSFLEPTVSTILTDDKLARCNSKEIAALELLSLANPIVFSTSTTEPETTHSSKLSDTTATVANERFQAENVSNQIHASEATSHDQNETDHASSQRIAFEINADDQLDISQDLNLPCAPSTPNKSTSSAPASNTNRNEKTVRKSLERSPKTPKGRYMQVHR